MAPAARELVFDQFVKPLILDVKDVTYVDYLKRGLEELPEEVPGFFDWMDRHKRDPSPRHSRPPPPATATPASSA